MQFRTHKPTLMALAVTSTIGFTDFAAAQLELEEVVGHTPERLTCLPTQINLESTRCVRPGSEKDTAEV